MSWFTNAVTQPRFITVPMAALGAARGGQDDAATVAAPDYPRVAIRDPAQWFDEWDYRSGCPPVPAVTSVQARPRTGTVQLSWRDAGLGVGYRVYVLPRGGDSYQLKVTTGADSVTFSGLPAARCLARVVPVNFRNNTGPPAQVAFTMA